MYSCLSPSPHSLSLTFLVLPSRRPVRPPQVTVIFKKLYDEDIVEEPAFKSWAEKVSKKYVDKALSQKIHDKAAPFIEWLA